MVLFLLYIFAAVDIGLGHSLNETVSRREMVLQATRLERFIFFKS